MTAVRSTTIFGDGSRASGTIVAMLIACCAGCHRTPPAAAPAPEPLANESTSKSVPAAQPATAAATQQVSAPLGDAPSQATDTIVVRPTTAMAPDDATSEGWESEAVSEQATTQLQQLAAWLSAPSHAATRSDNSSAPDGSSTSLSAWLTDEATAVTIPAAEWRVAYADPTFSVRRASRADAAQSSERLPPPEPATDFLQRLRAQDADCHDRHAKFKLFRVNLRGEQFETLQYVHWSGRRDSQSQEYNGTWRITWQRQGDQPPRMQAIVEVDAELVAIPSGQPWLNDCTLAVMRAVDAYPSEWRPGVQKWLASMESFLGVFNFAYQGIAVGDVNADHLDDVYLCQTGGLPNRLLIQQPDGTLVDVSAAAGVDYLDNTRSALFVDLDNDMDQDLVVALVSGVVFLENTGHVQFQPRARINGIKEGFSLAAADYDGDRNLDLYVCVYYGRDGNASSLPLPLPYFDARNGGANHLVRNAGNWQFEDVTEATGLDQDNSRYSFAATWEDIDNDGDLDLFVVNDFGPNQLYRNDAGHFREVASAIGLLDGAFGMSATLGDYDHDGHVDIYVSNMFSAAGNRVTTQPRFKTHESSETREKFRYLARGNSLFHNRGDGTFEDTSVAMKVTMGRWSWGSLFADLNNDRWDDLLVANGYVTGSKTDDL